MNAATRPEVVGVIYTGGTFGMVRSERGLAPSADLPGRVDAALRGRTDLPPVAWLDSGWPALASADTTPAFWYNLAATIAAAAPAHAGFVVIHGTDTLAYTGAALSFLLAGLGRPVVVTGARAPLGDAGSDALDNLVHALWVVADGRSDEVTLAFGGQLLRANRATKRHGAGDNPFASPCLAPLAALDPTLRWGEPAPPPPAPAATPVPRAAWRDVRVGVMPVHPGISGDSVRALAAAAPHALVLEGYPAGIGPGGDADFVAAVADAVAAGTVVAAISQGHHGSVRLGKYASSTPLVEAGIVGGADITREAAVAKLHVLRAAGLDADACARAFGEDLRGELTPAAGHPPA